MWEYRVFVNHKCITKIINDQGTKEGKADKVAEHNNCDPYKEKSRGEIGARSGGESCDEDGEADIDEGWYPSSTKTWRLPPKLGEDNETKRSRCE